MAKTRLLHVLFVAVLLPLPSARGECLGRPREIGTTCYIGSCKSPGSECHSEWSWSSGFYKQCRCKAVTPCYVRERHHCYAQLCRGAGYYIASGTCTKCGKGSFMDENPSGSTTCKNCPTGRHTDMVGAMSCDLCPAGYSQGGLGQTTCAGCWSGTFNDEPGMNECKQCPESWYQDKTKDQDCKKCPNGFFQGFKGKSKCLQCEAGTWAATCKYLDGDNDLLFHRPCYFSCSGPAKCAKLKGYCYCPDDYCAVDGKTCVPKDSFRKSCSKCSAGRYGPRTPPLYNPNQNDEDAEDRACDVCPNGHYTAQAGSTSCLACPRGSYSDGADGCRSGEGNGKLDDTACLLFCRGHAKCDSGNLQCFCPQGYCISPILDHLDDAKMRCVPEADHLKSCKQCKAGTYGDLIGAVSDSACKACPGGTFQDHPQGSSCKNCPVGTYQHERGIVSCQHCGPGKFLDETGRDAETDCKECAAGQFQDKHGKANCKLCPRGKFQNLRRKASCQDCGKGKYLDDVGKGEETECKMCPAGRFQEENGKPSCKFCPVGKFQNFGGISSCQNCGTGKYADTTGNDNVNKCKACSTGTFQDTIGQTSCKSCGKGLYQDRIDQSSCKGCSTGRFVATTGHGAASDCLLCNTGTYQDEVGHSSCKGCSRGTFGSAMGYNAASDCQECTKAHFQDETGTSSCKACGPGTYEDERGKQSCQICASGTFQDESGMSSCKDCGIGTFNVCKSTDRHFIAGRACNLYCSGDAECDKWDHKCYCPSGLCISPESNDCVSEVVKLAKCSHCGAGKYQDERRKSTCKDCPSGRYLDTTGNDNVNKCKACSTGTFQDTIGQTSCKSCGKGLYQDRIDQSSCKGCSTGRFVATTGHGAASDCLLCNTGTYQDEVGHSSCKGCSRGTFGSAMGYNAASDCQECTKAHFQDETGTSSCKACGPGTYGDEKGTSTCKGCRTGTFVETIGNNAPSYCKQCAQARYQDQTGQYRCMECDSGRYMDETGGSVCKLCPAGQHQNARGKRKCENCSPGKFQNKAGEHEEQDCISCMIGKYQRGEGKYSCIACPKGRFQDALGKDTCKGCSKGTFGDAESYNAASDCKSCPSGHHQKTIGQPSCSLCAEGRYEGNIGQSVCSSVCAAGKFSSARGQSSVATCKGCSSGEFSDPGATACKGCPAGHFQKDRSPSKQCSACPVGQFEAESGKVHCTTCLRGMFNDEMGQRSCKRCLLGRYTASTGLVSCTFCGLGMYQDENGGRTCKACEAGRFMKSTASLESSEPCQTALCACTQCPAGWSQPISAQQACLPCGAGQYSKLGAFTCAPCERGSYSIAYKAAVCITCPGGFEQPLSGEQSCSECKRGRFQKNTPAACARCLTGMFQPMVRQIACKACRAGMTTDVGVSTACNAKAPCEAGQYDTNGDDASAPTVCIDCPSGFVQFSWEAGPWQSSCSTCPVGTFAPSPRLSSCTVQISCRPGEYESIIPDISTKRVCSTCPADFFAAGSGSTSCQACPRGAHAPPGSMSCALCPAGFAEVSNLNKNNEELPLCTICSRGTYAPPGSSRCLFCSAGQIASVQGMSACTMCHKGTYSASSKGTTCTIWGTCPHGTFVAAVGSTTAPPSCAGCPNGKFSDIANARVCQVCLSGTFAVSGSSSCVAKTVCRPGEFDPSYRNDTTTAGGCKQCPPGFAQAEAAEASCHACPVGTFTSAAGEAICVAHVPCRPGKYQVASASATAQPQCHKCPSNFYSTHAGLNDCEACVGGGLSRQGAISCNNCPAGFAGGGVGSGSSDEVSSSPVCVKCIAGKISAEGATSCKACRVGMTAGQPGMSVCHTCLPGTYTMAEVAIKYVPYKTGFCDIAGKGKYKCSFADCQAACNIYSSCLGISYSDSQGCLLCTAPAFFAEDRKFTNANPVPTTVELFTYVKEAERKMDTTACSAFSTCAAGRFIAIPGSAVADRTCTLCGRGTYSNFENAPSCSTCPVGTYTDAPGSFVCRTKAKCIPGEYDASGSTNVMSAAACTKCPMGWHQSMAAGDQSMCLPCAAGTYAADPGGRPTCTPHVHCTPGKFQAEQLLTTAPSKCTACPVDTFSSVLDSAICTPCPAGGHAAAGSMSCNDCPAGHATSAPQTDPADAGLRCARCPAGTYGPQGATDCIPCDVGQIAASPASSACAACPVMTYTAFDARTGMVNATTCTEHLTCGKGNYFLDMGSATEPRKCRVCPKGTYGDTVNAPSCKRCAAGTFAAQAGSRGCVAKQQCMVGAYDDLHDIDRIHAGACKECPEGWFQPVAAGPQSSCRPCEGDTVAESKGQGMCRVQPRCRAGSYASTAGDATTPRVCTLCPEDYFASFGLSPECQACPEGARAAPGSMSCNMCPAGFSAGTTATFKVAGCASCPVGTFSPPGALTCIACSMGQFQSQPGHSVCETCLGCEAGKFRGGCSAGIGGSCSACPAGKFKGAYGTWSTPCLNCEPCGPGQERVGCTTQSTGGSCVQCASGTYKASGTSAWATCGHGHGAAIECAADYGTTTPCCGQDLKVHGIVAAALQCPESHPTCVGFGGGMSRGTCTSSACGSWSTVCTSWSEVSCPAGKHMSEDAPGSAVLDRTCKACSAGTFQTATNQRNCLACQPCAPGLYRDGCSGTSAGECVACPVGTYKAMSGAWNDGCAPWTSALCSKGKRIKIGFSGSTSSDRRCKTCAEGTFQLKANRDACKPHTVCPAGSYVPRWKAVDVTAPCVCADGRTGEYVTRGWVTRSVEECCRVAYSEYSAGQKEYLAQAWTNVPAGCTSIIDANGKLSMRFNKNTASSATTAAWPFMKSMCNTPAELNVELSPLLLQSQPTYRCVGGITAEIFRVVSSARCVEVGPTCTNPTKVSSACLLGELLHQSLDFEFDAASPIIDVRLPMPSPTADRSCRLCPAHFFSPNPNSQYCTRCPEGGSAAGSQTAAALACEQCPTGRYGKGKPSCTTCAAVCKPGQRETSPCGQRHNRVCHECPAGTWSAGGAQKNCIPWTNATCAPGSRLEPDFPGTDSVDRRCMPCQVGTFQVSSDKSACISCASCAVGAVRADCGNDYGGRCMLCPTGFHKAFGGKWYSSCIACAPCDVGQHRVDCGNSEENNHKLEDNMEEGSYPLKVTAHSSAGSCVLCPAETFKAMPGAWDTKCQAWAETVCAAGTRIDARYPGSIAQDRKCVACELGTFQMMQDQALCLNCQACPAGMKRNGCGEETQGACVDCLQSKFKAEIGEWYTACTDWHDASCLPGKRIEPDFPGSAQQDRRCAACPLGFFQPQINAKMCMEWQSCAAGSFVVGPAGVTRDRSCELCPVHFFTNATDSSACHQCPPGTAGAKGEGSTKCTGCPGGTFGAGDGEACLTCASECKAGSTETSGCGPTGNRKCETCEPGKWSTGGNMKCTDWTSALCTEGKHTFGHHVGSNKVDRQCADCGVGTFQASSGQSVCERCLPCPIGAYRVGCGGGSPGTCIECSLGMYKALEGSWHSICTAMGSCAPGDERKGHSAKDGGSCHECPLGKFKATTGTWSTSCAPWSEASCDAGSHIATSKPGSSRLDRKCITCAVGMFQSAANQHTCEACRVCARGSFASGCEGGTYAGSCHSCPHGTYKDHVGEWDTPCNACAPGFFNKHGDSAIRAECIACPTGFQGRGRHELCEVCPQGTFRDIPAGAECTKCSRGRWNQFIQSTDAAACVWCIAGTYLDTEAATSVTLCKACTVGRYGSFKGLARAMDCVHCDAGRFSITSGANTSERCLACDRGRYQDQVGASTCVRCRLGRTNPSTGASTSAMCRACKSRCKAKGTTMYHIVVNCTTEVDSVCAPIRFQQQGSPSEASDFPVKIHVAVIGVGFLMISIVLAAGFWHRVRKKDGGDISIELALMDSRSSAKASPPVTTPGADSNVVRNPMMDEDDTGNPLPAAYTEHVELRTGRPYYFNSNTKTTTWKRPTADENDVGNGVEVKKSKVRRLTGPIQGGGEITGGPPQEKKTAGAEQTGASTRSKRVEKAKLAFQRERADSLLSKLYSAKAPVPTPKPVESTMSKLSTSASTALHAVMSYTFDQFGAKEMTYLDADGDGVVTAAEIAEAEKISIEKAQEILSRFDKDGDGVLTRLDMKEVKAVLRKSTEPTMKHNYADMGHGVKVSFGADAIVEEGEDEDKKEMQATQQRDDVVADDNHDQASDIERQRRSDQQRCGAQEIRTPGSELQNVGHVALGGLDAAEELQHGRTGPRYTTRRQQRHGAAAETEVNATGNKGAVLSKAQKALSSGQQKLRKWKSVAELEVEAAAVQFEVDTKDLEGLDEALDSRIEVGDFVEILQGKRKGVTGKVTKFDFERSRWVVGPFIDEKGRMHYARVKTKNLRRVSGEVEARKRKRRVHKLHMKKEKEGDL